MARTPLGPLHSKAKFRLPRNIAGTIEFAKCWRPHQHVVGCIVSGVMDFRAPGTPVKRYHARGLPWYIRIVRGFVTGGQ